MKLIIRDTSDLDGPDFVIEKPNDWNLTHEHLLEGWDMSHDLQAARLLEVPDDQAIRLLAMQKASNDFHNLLSDAVDSGDAVALVDGFKKRFDE